MASKQEFQVTKNNIDSKHDDHQQQEQQLQQPKLHIENSKYTKRVVLKTLLNREDSGLPLVGERVVVGGWVKSSKEVRKQQPLPQPDHDQPQTGSKTGHKDVTCTELLQTRVPILRSFMKLFGVGGNGGKDFASNLAQRVQHPVLSTVTLQVSDGSCVNSLQVIVESTLAPPGRIMTSGTCILVEGVIQHPSTTSGKHTIELKAEKVLHLGVVEDHEKYPLSKKRLPLHTLRNWAHFRPRTTTVASMTRIRHELTQGTHTFFQNNGFLYVQVPVITTTDSEGFSDKFHVTTLLTKPTKEGSSPKSSVPDHGNDINLESIKASLKEKNNRVEELKRTDSNREALLAAVQDLKKTNELASQLEAKEKREKAKQNALINPDKLNVLDDFFSCQAFLTVSGRLHLESYACALGNVYSFGPRFKASTSQSTRHVSEMWMVEAEMAFAELEEAMSCATDLLKHLCKWVMEHCTEDMKFVLKRVDQNIGLRLQSVQSTEFEKIPYWKAIDVLKQVKGKNFAIEWGVPLTEEQESYLADEIYKKAVIIYDYPKEVKPFYVRHNDDGKTVAAFDVVVPKVGAVIRGSQNEERIKMLSTRIQELGLSSEQYDWYLDLRRHGTAKHAGFSLNFDLIVLMATGISDIRDVIPFQRSYGKLSN